MAGIPSHGSRQALPEHTLATGLFPALCSGVKMSNEYRRAFPYKEMLKFKIILVPKLETHWPGIASADYRSIPDLPGLKGRHQ
jgi:hypothetical protein